MLCFRTYNLSLPFVCKTEISRYKEHELAKERMMAIKNIRYLFESEEVTKDKIMFCGLRALLQKEQEKLHSLKNTRPFNTVIPSFGKTDVKGSCPTISRKKEDDDFEYFSKSMIAINKEANSPGY